jgi:hypothetical protein
MVQWCSRLWQWLFGRKQPDALPQLLSYNEKKLKDGIWHLADMIYFHRQDEAVKAIFQVIENSRNISVLEMATCSDIQLQKGRISAMGDLMSYLQMAVDTTHYKQRHRDDEATVTNIRRPMANRQAGAAI